MIKVNDIEIDEDIDSVEFVTNFHDKMSKSVSLLTLSNMLDDILKGKLSVEDFILREEVIELSSRVKVYKQEQIRQVNYGSCIEIWFQFFANLSKLKGPGIGCFT